MNVILMFSVYRGFAHTVDVCLASSLLTLHTNDLHLYTDAQHANSSTDQTSSETIILSKKFCICVCETESFVLSSPCAAQHILLKGLLTCLLMNPPAALTPTVQSSVILNNVPFNCLLNLCDSIGIQRPRRI